MGNGVVVIPAPETRVVPEFSVGMDRDEEEWYYPATDGEPMAESDAQRNWILYLVMVLSHFFHEQFHVYVSGNIFIYYEQGNPHKKVSPDVFVVFGVPNHTRTSYRLWREGYHMPQVVMEITSHATWTEDETTKPHLYRQLGVHEYIQYDPTSDYLDPALKGRQLHHGNQPMESFWNAHGVLCLKSVVLGLEFHLLPDGDLRVFDPQRQEYLWNYTEAMQAYAHESKARVKAEARAQTAEARAQTAEFRVKAEAEFRVKAEARAQEEQRKREALEEEIRRLKANQ